MKQLLFLLILSALISCKKELSHERPCGTIVYMDMLNAHVKYPDGTTEIIRRGNVFYLGKKICK